MLNQEQLAAIAAAMSILQNSMQSNSPTPANHHHQPPPTEHQSFISSPFVYPFQQQSLQQPTNLNLAAAVSGPSSPAIDQTQQKVISNNKAISKPVSYSAVVAKSMVFFGHHNGSLLDHQNHLHQGGLMTPLEPTLDYTTDHSTSPAQQLFHHSQDINQQVQLHQKNHVTHTIASSLSNMSSHHGSATNLLGFMGLYVGNLSPDLTKEQLEKIFAKYGEPVKAHRLVRSPVAFIKYENTESPRAAIDDLYGLLLPELTLNQDQPLKLHFDRNDAQLKANYRPTELPPNADNGECYGWRTTVCRRGKNCPKKHIPINRGIDFQMWMIKSSPTSIFLGSKS